MASCHPVTERQLTEAVRHGGDEAEVFDDVLDGKVSHEDSDAVTVLEAGAEDLFSEQQAEAIMEQHPVTVVGEMPFRGIEPLMQGEIIMSRAAPLLRGAFGVNERIAHGGKDSSAVWTSCTENGSRNPATRNSSQVTVDGSRSAR